MGTRVAPDSHSQAYKPSHQCVIQLSRTRNTIVGGSWNNTVNVWDTEKGTETLTLKGHTKGFLAVLFSRDGKRIVSGSYDKTVKVWDADKGTEISTLNGHSREVTSVSIQPGWQTVIIASLDNTVRVWDAEKRIEILTFKGNTSQITCLSFSPDGKPSSRQHGQDGKSVERGRRYGDSHPQGPQNGVTECCRSVQMANASSVAAMTRR